jgi:phosphopantothenoylcysteine decarboxylase
MTNRSPLGRLLIGICGSSAATATAELLEEARRYAQRVIVVATPAATRFLPELDAPVYTDDHWATDPLHVTLLDQTDTLLIAPTTATTLAKAAAGIADNLVSALILTYGSGVYFQPCMNARMWTSPALQRNVTALRNDGHHVLEAGPVASLTSDSLGSAVGAIPGTVLPTVARHRRTTLPRPN